MGTMMPHPNGKGEGEEHIFRGHIPAVPIPDGVSLPEFVLGGAEAYAEKVALVEADTGREYTYGGVVRDVRRLARALRSLGLRKGNVVVVVLPNAAVYPVVALGIMAAGGVFSGANPRATPSELRHQVEDAQAGLVVTTAPLYHKVSELGVPIMVVGEERVSGAEEGTPGVIYWEELLEAADRAGVGAASVEGEGSDCTDVVVQSDLCALPYSSGTTGTCKGVMLSHRNLVANLCSTLHGVNPEMAAGQVTTLGLMPFFHIYGIMGICFAGLRNRGKVVVMPRFELRPFMEALIHHEVNFAPIVPPIMLEMANSPTLLADFDLSRLKLQTVMTAAAPLAPDLLSAFEARFPGVQVQEAYGLTEHSCITLTHGDPAQGRPAAKRNSVGFVLPNLEVKFVDPGTGRSLPTNSPGELCVRSQCVMQGYYKKEEQTERTVDSEGWLHTGDVGYIDDDGDVFIVDRIKELIKYKGFQVAPAELEAILLSHPSVQDAAVFPLADEKAGEIPAACVVMAAAAEEEEEDIMSYVASKVAAYKRIRSLHFVDSIPKSSSGKIMRRLLRDEMANKEIKEKGTSMKAPKMAAA
uniref:4-coumarate--CoA ligase n=1 Tax=Anthurium amnicola TaxID=1678845 RepID=A0A1D1ZDX3_9ARAE